MVGRIIKILPVYALAVYAALTLYAYPILDLHDYLYRVLSFQTQPTFYFVLLIIELYILFPLLYALSGFSKKIPGRLLTLVLVGFVAYIWPFLKAPYPFVPAGIIIGGGFLFIFYAGMLYGRYGIKMPRHGWIAVICGMVITDYLYIVYGKNLDHTALFFVLLQSWSLFLLFVIKRLITFIPKGVSAFLAIIGRQSLYIFLFHYAVIHYLFENRPHTIMLFVTTYIIGITLPIIFGVLYEKIYKWIKYRSLPIFTVR